MKERYGGPVHIADRDLYYSDQSAAGVTIQMSKVNLLRVIPGRREAILGQPSIPPAEIAASTGTRVGRVDRVGGLGRRRW